MTVFDVSKTKEKKQKEYRKAAHDTRIRLISLVPCHTLHIQITSHYIISFRLLTLTHTHARLALVWHVRCSVGERGMHVATIHEVLGATTEGVRATEKPIDAPVACLDSDFIVD